MMQYISIIRSTLFIDEWFFFPCVNSHVDSSITGSRIVRRYRIEHRKYTLWVKDWSLMLFRRARGLILLLRFVAATNVFIMMILSTTQAVMVVGGAYALTNFGGLSCMARLLKMSTQSSRPRERGILLFVNTLGNNLFTCDACSLLLWWLPRFESSTFPGQLEFYKG